MTTLFRFFLVLLCASSLGAQVDFLDKVNEIDETAVEKQPEIQKDEPEKKVITKEPVKVVAPKYVPKPVKTKKTVPSPVWIDEFTPINDDYLLQRTIPKNVKPQENGEESEQNETAIVGDKNEKKVNITAFFDDLAQYKKALIILFLLVIFAAYRFRTGRNVRSSSPRTITKYRKK